MVVSDLLADLYPESGRSLARGADTDDSYNQMLSASNYAYGGGSQSQADGLTSGDIALAATFLVMGSGLVWLAYTALAS